MGRFLSVDPMAKSYPMLTPYQFASNSPVANIDLDGLESYNVASADFSQQMTAQINECTNDEDVLKLLDRLENRYASKGFGGYFSANSRQHAMEFYESTGEAIVIENTEGPLRVFGYTNANDGEVVRYQIYGSRDFATPEVPISEPTPEVNPERKGVYNIFGYDVSFETEGGITYGHAALSLELAQGKGAGFNMQAGNYLVGGKYNSQTGGNPYLMEMDEINLIAEGNYGFLGASYTGKFTPSTGKISNSDANIVVGVPDKIDLKFVNASSASKNSQGSFLGPELNIGIGIGIRAKVGLLITKQDKND